MPGIGNVLNEFLVDIGFKVDPAGINDFFSSFERGASRLSAFSAKFINNPVVDAIRTFTGLVAASSKTVFNLAGSVATYDKQMELLARKNWMSKDSFVVLNSAIKALGYNDLDDLGTIALDPELSKQFKELYAMSQDFQSQFSEYDESLKTMREFQFQFLRLRFIGTNFLKLLGASIVKHIEGPLGKSNFSLSSFIGKIQRDLPMYVDRATKKIAPFFSRLLDFGSKVIRASSKLYDYLKKHPRVLKTIAGAAMLIYGFFDKTGFVAFALFRTLTGVSEAMKDSDGIMKSLSQKFESVKAAAKDIYEIGGLVFDLVVLIIDKLEQTGIFKAIKTFLEWLYNILTGNFGKARSIFIENKFDDPYVRDRQNELANMQMDDPNLDLSEFYENLAKKYGAASVEDFLRSDVYKNTYYNGNSSTISNSNNTFNTNINIDGSDNPKETAKETAEALNSAMLNGMWGSN